MDILIEFMTAPGEGNGDPEFIRGNVQQNAIIVRLFRGVHPNISMLIEAYLVDEAENIMLSTTRTGFQKGTLRFNITLYNPTEIAYYQIYLDTTTNDTADACGNILPAYLWYKPPKTTLPMGVLRFYTISKSTVMLYARLHERCQSDGLPSYCNYTLFNDPFMYPIGNPRVLMDIRPFKQSASVFPDLLIVNNSGASYFPIQCHYYDPPQSLDLIYKFILPVGLIGIVASASILFIIFRDKPPVEESEPPLKEFKMNSSDIDYLYGDHPELEVEKKTLEYRIHLYYNNRIHGNNNKNGNHYINTNRNDNNFIDVPKDVGKIYVTGTNLANQSLNEVMYLHVWNKTYGPNLFVDLNALSTKDGSSNDNLLRLKPSKDSSLLYFSFPFDTSIAWPLFAMNITIDVRKVGDHQPVIRSNFQIGAMIIQQTERCMSQVLPIDATKASCVMGLLQCPADLEIPLDGPSCDLKAHHMEEPQDIMVSTYFTEFQKGALRFNITLYDAAEYAGYQVYMDVTTNDTMDDCGGKWPIHFNYKRPLDPTARYIDIRLFTISKDSVMLYSRLPQRCEMDNHPEFCSYHLHGDPFMYPTGNPRIKLNFPAFTRYSSVYPDFLVTNFTNAPYHPIKCQQLIPTTPFELIFKYVLSIGLTGLAAFISIIYFTLKDNAIKYAKLIFRPSDPAENPIKIDPSDLDYIYGPHIIHNYTNNFELGRRSANLSTNIESSTNGSTVDELDDGRFPDKDLPIWGIPLTNLEIEIRKWADFPAFNEV
eukprot:gene8178-9618_t